LGTPSNICQSICWNTPYCGDSGYTSYCKSDGLCYGLYHRGNAAYCYQPEDPSCNGDVLEPVSCSQDVVASCEDVCDSIPSCHASKSKSHCRTWAKAPVCYGIFKRDDGSLCYGPEDGDCHGTPLECPSIQLRNEAVHSSLTTTCTSDEQSNKVNGIVVVV
ncbi:hypothetical protein Pmar_PMAR014830, partial [Perkinsus marinus ATCC 50983]